MKCFEVESSVDKTLGTKNDADIRRDLDRRKFKFSSSKWGLMCLVSSLVFGPVSTGPKIDEEPLH